LRHEENVLLVAPEDPQGLCEAVMRLQRDAQLLRRIGSGARELAQQFTWKQIARRTLDEVFRPLVSRAGNS
jgi:glycosyltransferase involved in cell wall biosynthesis